MPSRPVFCFIDDAAFELDNFREHAAPGFERAEFVCASSFEQAVEQLAGRRPLCFLLDIYGTDPALDKPRLLKPERLAALVGEPVEVDRFYQGVDPDSREGGNLFLRRIYGRVQGWQQAFLEAAEALGQGRGYGLANLALVRESFPWAAALGYSRKSMYLDGVEMCRAGADGLLQKPQGADDQAIARATRRQAPELARVAYRAVDQRLSLVAGRLGLRLCLQGEATELCGALGLALEALAGEDTEQRREAAQALGGVRLEELGLATEELQAVLALGDWLAAG